MSISTLENSAMKDDQEFEQNDSLEPLLLSLTKKLDSVVEENDTICKNLEIKIQNYKENQGLDQIN